MNAYDLSLQKNNNCLIDILILDSDDGGGKNSAKNSLCISKQFMKKSRIDE